MTDALRHFKPGQTVRVTARVRSGGTLADPESSAGIFVDPNGTENTVVPTRDSLGSYVLAFDLPMIAVPGTWAVRMTTVGTPPDKDGLEEMQFVVDPLLFT